MKSVLFIKPIVRSGSYYFRTEQYMEYFRKRDFQILVLKSSPDGSTLLEKIPLKQTISKFLFLISQFPKFIFDLVRSDIVVIYPSPQSVIYFLMSKLFGKKVIIDHIVSYYSHHDLFSWFPIWIDRLVYGLADVILTHTDTMKEGLVQKLKIRQPDKILVAYCDVDLQAFSPRYGSKVHELKQKLRISDKKIVFYHGLHHTWHGVDILLGAAKILENKRKDIVFVFLPGFAPDVSAPSNVINLKAAEHYSWETLPAYIQMADIWCSGFRIEERGERSFGSTPVQALALARPILTTASAEKSKFLNENENVLYVPPESPNVLAERISFYLDHPEILSQIGRNGRKTAEEHFSIAKLDSVLSEALHLSDQKFAAKNPSRT